MKKINHKQRAHKKLLLVAISTILCTFALSTILPTSTYAKTTCSNHKYWQWCIDDKAKKCTVKEKKESSSSTAKTQKSIVTKFRKKYNDDEKKKKEATKVGSAISDAVSSVVGTTTTAVNDATNNAANNTPGNNSSTSGTTPSTTTTIKPPTFTGQCDYFLGLTSWSCGVDISDQASLKNGIWQIVANVAADITVIAAYLILGFVIYGGYLYMFSAGDSGKVEKGKKTLTHAFIGLAIVLLANAIMSTIRYILGGQLDGGGSPEAIVSNAINWFIGIAGLVSVIFIVYGGISYMTSRGDPGKIQKAKHTILYALIGLAIVALSIAISAFVSSTIDNAKKASQINQTTISKEVYENNQII